MSRGRAKFIEDRPPFPFGHEQARILTALVAPGSRSRSTPNKRALQRALQRARASERSIAPIKNPRREQRGILKECNFCCEMRVIRG